MKYKPLLLVVQILVAFALAYYTWFLYNIAVTERETSSTFQISQKLDQKFDKILSIKSKDIGTTPISDHSWFSSASYFPAIWSGVLLVFTLAVISRNILKQNAA